MSLFFLSYARQDAEGRFVDKFFMDLSKEIRDRTAMPSDPGFRDTRGIELGESWPTELSNALRSCKLFVSLYSPSYFTSEYCGKEWQAFVNRLEAYETRFNTRRPPLIIPILWMPTPRLPEVTHDIQYGHEELGSVYATEGLHFLLRLKKYDDDYQELLVRLATKLIEIADRHTLPLGEELDLKTIPNAFARSQNPSVRAKILASSGGPRLVHFVIVAGTADQMSGIRKATDFYGAHSQDWRPYQPVFNGRIGAFAQGVAAADDLLSQLATIEDDLMELLAVARERNEIVVFLVDSWTLRFQNYSEIVKQYDRQNFLNCAVMLLWNSDDPETIADAERLRTAIHWTFENNVARGDVKVFREDVSTVESFATELKEVLTETQRRIFVRGAVARRAIGENIIVRPVLVGPSGG